MEQRTIIEATNRALDYAHEHGVTLIAARGQRAHRPRRPDGRRHQPDYPPGTEYHRDVDNSCLTMPTEGTT